MFSEDDCFIFFHANEPESKMVKEIIEDYAKASGQLINYDKSSISSNKNIGEEDQRWVMDILGVHNTWGNSNYLGLPSLIGRRKNEILAFIQTKIVACIHSWNNKFLSRAGREILLKNVIQAVPIYEMSVFLLPK